MKTIRRLVVSLDGTWNNRDDSTNVLYSHSLAFECNEKIWKGDQVTQQRYYQEGVGTGPLDRITGGGFGLGLEEHVREAYDWLVQNYEEGNGTADNPPDEIYIFGFSRGAYTARSLVGFISTCGLLRRGAPLTVNQLWENHCILGLEREERNGGLARKIFGTPAASFRRITDLKWDPWSVRNSKPGHADEVPGLRPGLALTPTEELLVRWSRRVKITFLGVYDTVGAMGWDALAIPGLRSKLATQHNMRPTTIIQKCRHALAIDEHRSSFRHTPFVAYIGGKTASGELERDSGATTAEAADGFKIRGENWDQLAKMWTQKIEQRWFVGAHSNIGGGYPDNVLAQRPLAWMLQGARDAGLICEQLPAAPSLTVARVKPRDSFAEFVSPLWTTVFHAKRHYRVIDPVAELRANRDEKKTKGEPRAGFSLVNINEQVDETALDYWQDSEAVPPNLAEYAARHSASDQKAAAKLAALTAKPSANRWPGEGFLPQVALVLWATFAAGGVAVTDRLFQVWRPVPPWWLLILVAGLFPLVDWLESHTNSVVARKGVTPLCRALLDSIYWARSLGVVWGVFGLFGMAFYFWSTGWQASSFEDAGRAVHSLGWNCGGIALGAAAGTFLANIFNGTLTPGLGKKFGAWLTGVVTILGFMALTILFARVIGHVVLAVVEGSHVPVAVIPPVNEAVRVAGLLLLLQLAVAYFAEAFNWVGEPTGKANLGSIVGLQLKFTPAGVKAQLDRWCKMLGEHHHSPTAECGMTGVVRQSLWRDVFGFIPVYSTMIAFGWWFGARQLGWKEGCPALDYLWWALPLLGVAADYGENLCHFRYLYLHERGRTPAPLLTGFSFAMTVVKFAAFIIGILGVVWAVLSASWDIARDPHDYGWRGLIALLGTSGTLLFAVGVTGWGWVYRLLNYWEKQRAHASKI